MNSKMLNYFQSMPKDKVKSTFNIAMACLFAIEFIGTIGIYIALKAWASQMWAELWMLIAFGYVLKNELAFLEPILQKEVLKKTRHGEEDEEKPEEALAEDSAKD